MWHYECDEKEDFCFRQTELSSESKESLIISKNSDKDDPSEPVQEDGTASRAPPTSSADIYNTLMV